MPNSAELKLCLNEQLKPTYPSTHLNYNIMYIFSLDVGSKTLCCLLHEASHVTSLSQ